jgi:polysaccharide pyruvyl transferase WcaK-like protein
MTPECLSTIGQALQEVHARTQAFIVLIPFQLSQDLMVAQTLHTQLPEISHVVRLTDPRQLKGVFQEVDMAIAMRLHGLIMAAAEGCNCFGISYDPKVQRLMEDIHCPGWELAQMPDRASTIAQQWIQQFNSPATLSLEQREHLIQQSMKHQHLLTDLLSPSA